LKFLQHITLETSGIGGSLTHDYFKGKKELKKFYTFNPDLEGLKSAALERMPKNINRQVLYKELHRQYNSSVLSEELKSNLELLLQPNTFTVTTGHQLNLFTGPLYFIYKIASVIKLAEILKHEIPGKHFVPVYWMNSEDHDFAEINHFFLHSEKFEWKVDLDKYGPVGRMKLDGIEALMTEIKNKWEEHFKYEPLFNQFIGSYLDSKDLAQAHRNIVNKLFGEYGVVILDQDSKALKAEFSEYIAEEIFEASSISKVQESNNELEALGYKAQVFVREINYFYTGTGYRERIVEVDKGYALADSTLKWNREELEKELKDHPEFFSPNVVTRPLYQEFSLPNIAYIGGPAEIAYWLQYKKNFGAKDLFFPALILRDCFLLLPEKKYRKSKELGLRLDQYFHNIDELINEFIKEHYRVELNIDPILKVLNDQYDQLLKQVIAIDPSMDNMVKAGHKKSLNELDRIASKMNRALKKKSEHQVSIIKDLHASIFPLNTLQERLNNLFDQTQSPSTFIKDILEHADPLDPRLKVLLD
jgi:bacillithiol biosynthesis cysteine-adding enzyme BshC